MDFDDDLDNFFCYDLVDTVREQQGIKELRKNYIIRGEIVNLSENSWYKTNKKYMWMTQNKHDKSIEVVIKVFKRDWIKKSKSFVSSTSTPQSIERH